MPSECGQYIETQTVAHPCDLPPNHLGPHRSIDIPRSVSARERWERSQGDLEQFQGPAQTTAERYTLNPTPVPGSEPEPDAPSVYIEDSVREVPPSEAESMHRTTSEDFLPRTTAELEAQQPSPTNPPHGPTKQREGDQVLPTQNDGEAVQQRIIEKARTLNARGDLRDDQLAVIEAYMAESIEVGTERYGTPLQTFNGRDVLQDIVEEARDLFVYLAQARQARDEDQEKLVQLVISEIYQSYQEGEQPTVESLVRQTVNFVLDAITVI